MIENRSDKKLRILETSERSGEVSKIGPLRSSAHGARRLLLAGDLLPSPLQPCPLGDEKQSRSILAWPSPSLPGLLLSGLLSSLGLPPSSLYREKRRREQPAVEARKLALQSNSRTCSIRSSDAERLSLLVMGPVSATVTVMATRPELRGIVGGGPHPASRSWLVDEFQGTGLATGRLGVTKSHSRPHL